MKKYIIYYIYIPYGVKIFQTKDTLTFEDLIFCSFVLMSDFHTVHNRQAPYMEVKNISLTYTGLCLASSNRAEVNQ